MGSDFEENHARWNTFQIVELKCSLQHALVLHRGPDGKGGLTFGAGTVQWSWGLEGLHDVNDPPRANKYAIRVARVDGLHGASRDVQQLTANVEAATS